MDTLEALKECKPWYTSKTVWFNVITIIGTTVDGFVSMLYLIEPFIAPGAYPFIMLGVGLINIMLRAITTTALATKQEANWRNGRTDVFVD